MSIQIGTVKSVGKCENFSVAPDNREELVQLVGGVVVTDGGRITDGDVTSLQATFSAADGATIMGWANTRTKQNVTLEDGSTINNARIIIRRISYPDYIGFRSKYTVLDMEFWRV